MILSNHSEVLDVLRDAIFVEEVLDDFDVLSLSLLFAFALVAGPGSPLGFGFQLNSPGFLVVAVSSSTLLVEAIEGKFFIIGDFLDSWFFA